MSKLKILNELRPASEGFAGIPQETRVLHSLLLENKDYETQGLLNGNTVALSSLMKKQSKSKKDEIFYRSRAFIELAEIDEKQGFINSLNKKRSKALNIFNLKLQSLFNMPTNIYPIEVKEHGDFLWGKYFSKALPTKDFQKIISSNYLTLRPTWMELQYVGICSPSVGKYCKLNTSDFDVMISQTPWPAEISKNTKLIIRYHDAIPIYYPHTIHSAFRHNFTHYFPLKSNLKKGAVVVCNSENSKSEVLNMFPEYEEKVQVIPCAVSENYYKTASVSREQIVDVVRSSIETSTAPTFKNIRDESLFYERHLREKDFKYLVMVSTIEPRKNHSRLIAAWNVLRKTKYSDLKLVIVGVPGWNVSKTLQSMKPFQSRGLLFNISKVNSSDLRQLYAGAEAVVCPSIAEGFDLSGIEAMLSGGVVAASDIPVHSEIYKDGCSYFNPYSTGEAVEAISHLLDENNIEERENIRVRGGQVALQYRQHVIADQWYGYLDKIRSEKLGEKSNVSDA